ncbi:MAG: hypothetical protein H6722_28530 [Sandaracinus sp.]|nr:hypothetical protein [Myxococcales bacterium]MCB9616401.1 hypothetical protein [Sandaracinus sp.]
MLNVLRAAYRLDVDEATWVEGVARALTPHLDVGCGVQTFLADFRDGGAPLRHERLDGGVDDWRSVWRQNWWEPHVVALPRRELAGVIGFAPISHALDVWGGLSRKMPTYAEFLRSLAEHGWSDALEPVVGAPAEHDEDRLFYPDSLNLFAFDPSGVALGFVANRPERAAVGETSRATARWSRVCGHLTAALRLRLAKQGTLLSGAEAVFTPDGALAHAEGVAVDKRDALTDAVKERAAAHHADDGQEALTRWRALHDARWSLVDVEENDGKRWIVAHPNAPAGFVLDRLSSRERQVLALLSLGRSNKAIAYELGISSSTVATLVARARWKLGVESVSELVRLGREATVFA